MLSDDGIPLSPEPLVTLAQTGDEAAWATLVTSYYPELSGYLRRNLSSMQCCLEDVDDLAQETFTKAWRSLWSLEQVSKFKPWLYRIATNVVYDYGRRQNSQRRLPLVSLEQHWEECAVLNASQRFEEELSLVETLAQACWQLLPHRAHRVDDRHLDYVRSYQHLLAGWLTSAPRTSVIRIASVLSKVTLVEGWLLHALNRQHEAERTCREAILVAHHAGNVQLEAIGVTCLGNFLIDTGQTRRVVDWVQAVRRRAEKAGATPLMQAWMAATEADAWAHQREVYQAAYQSEVALDRAVALTPSEASKSEPDSIPYDLPWLHGYRGAVYAHLGHAQRAQSELERGLASLGPELVIRRCGLYHDLIIAYSLGKQVEEACQCARLAMSAAKQTQVLLHLRRVRDTTHQFLTPWKESPPVRDLLEEIRLAQQKLSAALR